MKTISELQTQFSKTHKETLESLKPLIGKDITIPEGKFKGRKGRITSMVIDNEGDIRAMCQPYRLTKTGSELLWDHADCRTYWQIKDEDLI